MAKRKSSLKGQVVKRKKVNYLSALWKLFSFIGTSFFKFSCLVIGLIAISLLFLVTYQYLLTSPHIKLEQVIIQGVDRDMKTKLLEIANLDYDLSLLAINMNQVKQRLEEHPWVRKAELEKKFPHTLIIRAEKEKPRAVVLLDKLYYMDQEGNIFKEIEDHEEIDLPVITGISRDELEEGQKLKLAARTLAALGVKSDLWSQEDISEINVRGPGTVSIYFRPMQAVVKIKADELELKVHEMEKVFAHLTSSGRIRDARSISMDYGDGVVVSF